MIVSLRIVASLIASSALCGLSRHSPQFGALAADNIDFAQMLTKAGFLGTFCQLMSINVAPAKRGQGWSIITP